MSWYGRRLRFSIMPPLALKPVADAPFCKQWAEAAKCRSGQMQAGKAANCTCKPSLLAQTARRCCENRELARVRSHSEKRWETSCSTKVERRFWKLFMDTTRHYPN